MTGDAPAAKTTALDVLRAFDAKHSSVGLAVARGEYAFWFGAGLSRLVVPDVRELLRNVLSYLQERVVLGDESCPYRRCLFDIFAIADFSVDDVDFELATSTWPNLEKLLRVLNNNYSTVLDVDVPGDEDEDFLVWHAIDVPRSYGNPTLEPDAGHLCVAMLILEGVITSAVTTNWDGLTEAAVERLHGSTSDVLRVLVHNDEFRDAPDAHATLVKFHGCAVKAAADPDRYRPLLIARESQIATWAHNADFALASGHLTQLVATQPTFVIGLSGQDANIHTLLSAATTKLAREWPSDPAAMVFALEELTQAQRLVLKLIYGPTTYTANAEEIEESALLGVYAQPLLVALVLFTLSEKLCALIASNPHSNWDAGVTDDLQRGVRYLRDLVGGIDGAESSEFVCQLISAFSLVLAVFRTGEAPAADSPIYEPLTSTAISRSQTDPNVDKGALRNLAVVASILGRGSAEQHWELHPGTPTEPEQGVFKAITEAAGASKVFLVKDDQVLATLQSDAMVDLDDPEVLAIHAQAIPPAQRRFPGSRIGRGLNRSGREVSIAAILDEATDAEDLYQRFRQEAAI